VHELHSRTKSIIRSLPNSRAILQSLECDPGYSKGLAEEMHLWIAKIAQSNSNQAKALFWTQDDALTKRQRDAVNSSHEKEERWVYDCE